MSELCQCAERGLAISPFPCEGFKLDESSASRSCVSCGHFADCHLIYDIKYRFATGTGYMSAYVDPDIPDFTPIELEFIKQANPQFVRVDFWWGPQDFLNLSELITHQVKVELARINLGSALLQEMCERDAERCGGMGDTLHSR